MTEEEKAWNPTMCGGKEPGLSLDCAVDIADHMLKEYGPTHSKYNADALIVLNAALRACRKERDKAIANARCGWETAQASDRAREKVEKERDEALRKLAEVKKFISVASISDTTPWSKEQLVRAARLLSDFAIRFGVSLEHYITSIGDIRRKLAEAEKVIVAMREAAKELLDARSFGNAYEIVGKDKDGNSLNSEGLAVYRLESILSLAHSDLRDKMLVDGEALEKWKRRIYRIFEEPGQHREICMTINKYGEGAAGNSVVSVESIKDIDCVLEQEAAALAPGADEQETDQERREKGDTEKLRGGE